MLLEIVSAKYLGAYNILLLFNTGYQAAVDLEPTLFRESRNIFAPLRDMNYFKTFSVKLNTICWENEADFAPEFLYELARSQERHDGELLQKAA